MDEERSDACVAFLPRLMITSRLDLKTSLVDEPSFRWRLGLIWRSNSPLSPMGRRVMELAKKLRGSDPISDSLSKG